MKGEKLARSEEAARVIAEGERLTSSWPAVATPEEWDEHYGFLTGKEKRVVSQQPCGVCGRNTLDLNESFMLHDEVWQEALANIDGPVSFLCVGCCEEALGRELTTVDFTNVLLNVQAALAGSPTLSRRLTTPGPVA